jgi:hypothetical protein
MTTPLYFGGFAVLLAVWLLSEWLDYRDRQRTRRRRDAMLHIRKERTA